MTIRIGAHVDQTDPLAEAQARGAAWCSSSSATRRATRARRSATPAAPTGCGPTPRRRASTSTCTRRTSSTSRPRTTGSGSRRRKLLQQHVDAAAAIGAKGLIVHGGHVDKDDDPAQGLRQLAQGGRGHRPQAAAADREHRRRRQRDGPRPRADRPGVGRDRPRRAVRQVGFCLDTCHAHAGGNGARDGRRRRHGDHRADRPGARNDSRDEFDSGADRHANLGTGRIDPDLLAAVVRDAGAPVVCETPGGAERAPRRLRLAARAALTPSPWGKLVGDDQPQVAHLDRGVQLVAGELQGHRLGPAGAPEHQEP